MSQAATSPPSNPRWNHSRRCSAVPWVKLSGSMRPAGLRLDPVVADRRRRVQPLLQVPLLQQVVLVGRVGPDAREAVGLQLQEHRELVGVARAAAPLGVHLAHDPEQVLDVVAELVGDDVRLGEVARGAEALLQLAEEAEVEVDLAVDGAVEGARRGGRAAAPLRAHAAAEEHEPGRLVLPAGRAELLVPRVLDVVHHEGDEVAQVRLRIGAALHDVLGRRRRGLEGVEARADLEAVAAPAAEKHHQQRDDHADDPRPADAAADLAAGDHAAAAAGAAPVLDAGGVPR